jgi:ABC-type dipeptide/oligopeptide/nickel transport system permease component
MAKKKSRSLKKNEQEMDSTYLLKLVLYMIIGSQWVRITKGSTQFPLPVGLVIGILFAMHDHFQIDRKVEYALLLASTFVAFWLPLGLEIAIK